jgi:hypothetical protein
VHPVHHAEQGSRPDDQWVGAQCEGHSPRRAEQGDAEEHAAVPQAVSKEGHDEGGARGAGGPDANDQPDGSGIEPDLAEVDAQKHADEAGGERPHKGGQVEQLLVAHNLLPRG